MNYFEYQLGSLDRGDVVAVTLSTGANVRLMDSSNLSAYSRGAAHSYYGGLMRSSPARIAVPSTGNWYVTVDLAGLRASGVSAGVSVEFGPNHRRYMAPPTRRDGYYSEQREDGTIAYFIGPDGAITAERPHVHVIHSKIEDQIIIEGTHSDGQHFGKKSLAFDASPAEVDQWVAKLRRLLH